MFAAPSDLPQFSSLPVHPFPIAGFSHYAGARALPALREGSLLTLRPEPGNPHDMHAVEILHGAAKLGYVPRFCNRHVSHMLAEGVPVTCEISRVDPSSPPWEAVAIRISPVPSETMPGPTGPSELRVGQPHAAMLEGRSVMVPDQRLPMAGTVRH